MRALVLAAVVLVGGVAQADNRTEAIALFDQGLKEMKAGNYEKACKFFADSNTLVPDSGTKGSLARCYEKLGKLASSWVLWRELADLASSGELRKDAANQAAKLDPRVPKYVVKVGAPTPGLTVTINGKPINPTIAIPVPIDPGPVVALATAPDHQEWKADLKAAEGATLTIEIPALVAVVKDIVQPPPPPIVDNSKRRKRHIIGATVIGAGVAAVVVGGIFGVSARSKFDDAKQTCGGSIDSCDPDRLMEAQGQVDDSRKAANLSSIMFGAGGALVVTGVVIWITAPSLEKRGVAIAPAVEPGAAGFVVSGRF